jgi:hypothetical protein
MKFRKGSLKKNIVSKAPSKPAPSEKKGSVVVTAITLFSLVGTFLTLVGYGVAVSVDSVFDVPHQSLFGAPFELLGLSVWAILRVLSTLSLNLEFGKNYAAILHQLLPAFCVTALLIVVGVVATKIHFSRVRGRGALPSWLQKVVSAPSAKDSSRSLILKASAVAAAIFLSLPLVIVTSILIAGVGVAVLAIAPALGMSAGAAHIKEYVIDPTRCAPLYDRKTRMGAKSVSGRNSETFATCLRVSNDKRLLGIGRSVFVTSSAVILFDPASGAVWRAPTRDAVIEKVDQLVPSSPPQVPMSTAETQAAKSLSAGPGLK